jgi:hypothetical protein
LNFEKDNPDEDLLIHGHIKAFWNRDRYKLPDVADHDSMTYTYLVDMKSLISKRILTLNGMIA